MEIRQPEKLRVAASQFVKEKDFWLDKLSGELCKTSFQYDNGKVESAMGSRENLKFSISGELFSRLNRLSSSNDHTLHMILIAGIVLLLSKYTGNKDIIVGTPIYKQDIETEFVNTVLTLRNQLNNDMTFKELLLQVRATVLEATENYSYPFEILMEQLNIGSPGEGFQVFDVVILLENIHDKSYIQHIKNNMTFCFRRLNECIELELEYNSSLYLAWTIEKIFNHLNSLLHQGTSDVNTQLSQLHPLTSEETKHLLEGFNNTGREYDKDKTIHQLFEEQVEETPDKIALVLKNQHLSYRELNIKANQVAGLLRKKGVKGDSIVGVMIDRSLEMIVALLGVLKAGGAYLPIDSQYPQKRILSMLNDSGARILLTQETLTRGLLFSRFQNIFSFKNEPVITAPRAQIKDFNGLMLPDRSLLDYQKYHKHIGQGMVRDSITFQATRGCPFRCAFCHKIWPRNHVVRSAENIFNEVKSYYDLGIRRFVFVDDIFNLDAKNSTRFFELIVKNGLKVHFHNPNGLRGDILSKDYIDLMVEAGTVNVALALETASPRLQKLIGKNLNIEKLCDNLQYFIDKHPHVTLELQTMHGFPTETEEEAMMTLDLTMSFKWIDIPYIHLVKIYPNSDLARLAIDMGISAEAIDRASDSGYHIYSETIPFPKSFTSRYQTTLMNEYFLSRERLLAVLPRQMKILKEDELVQKYDSYLPASIKTFQALLDLAGISRDELEQTEFLSDDFGTVPDFNKKVRAYFPAHKCKPNALRVLLLDLSMTFSRESLNIYDIADTPLGLMYVLTYLNQQYGDAVKGKIAKARIDFDNFEELRTLVEDFNPDIIGVRTLSYFRNFLHKTISLIRQWGIEVPVIAGGPYATSDYITILKDSNIDCVVRGEGEVTFAEVIGKMIENGGKWPGSEQLEKINGISFMREDDKKYLKENNREIIMLDQVRDQLEMLPGENLENINVSSDMAYLIYTSGSTGHPKGVMLTHRNLNNLLNFQFNETNIDFSGRVLQFTTISFDVSFQEIFSTLLAGGNLCMMDNETRMDIDKMLRLIEKNRINILFHPASFFKNILLEGDHLDELPTSIKHIVTAGEQLVVTDEIREYLKENQVYLHNHYGPSETHVVTALTMSPHEYIPDLPPIGKPIFNTQIYILNEEEQLQPVGMAGELCIGGDNVGRGYWRQPDITSEKFVDNPFIPGNKMYRTGDLARWLPSGDIEFLGRKDHQVKIRGFRIELGEIEKKMLAHEKIKEAVVIDRKINNSTQYLSAFFVTEPDQEFDLGDFKEYLVQELPDYMIPNRFMMLEEIPLTFNGKLDRKVLNELDERIDTSVDYVAPRNETEKKLARIWAKVLDLKDDNFSINSDFFEMGGNSIKIMQINSEINREFGFEISFKDFMHLGQISLLAQFISENAEKEGMIKYPCITPDFENMHEPFPLTDIQMAYLMGRNSEIELGGGSTHIYFEVNRALDIGRLNQCCNRLIRRHAMLRTIIMENGQQRILEDISGYEIAVEDLENLTVEEQEERIARERERMSHDVIDTSQWPLFEIKGFKLGKGMSHLCVSFDPLIADAYSMNIIAEELNNLLMNPELELPPLEFSFRDYMVTYQELKASEIYQRDKNYWLDQLEDFPSAPVPPLRCDLSAIKKPRFNSHYHQFSRSQWKILKQQAREHNIITATLLCTAYAEVLAYWSNQPRMAINLTVFNRFPFHPDVDKIVGDFTSLILLGLELRRGNSFWQRVKQVQEVLFEGLEHRHYDGVEFIRELARHHKLVNKAVMPVVFTCTLMDTGDTGEDAGDSEEGQDEEAETDDQSLRTNITQTSQVFLDNVVVERDGYLQVYWFFVEDLFEPEVIGLMFQQYIDILTHAAAGNNEWENVLRLPPGDQAILDQYNSTSEEIPAATLRQLILDQVNQTPDNTAVVFGPERITYKELDEKSNRVASYLREQGVKPKDFVGILTPRRIDTMVNVVGILKTGASYVPIDPEYPEERRRYILENSNCTYLLEPDVSQVNQLEKYPCAGLGDETVSGDIAYVIYTSGSTGRPKGVVISHRQVTNTIIHINRRFHVNEGDRIMGISSMCFDLSVYDVFGAFSTGAALVLVADQRDIINLLSTLETHCISIWNSVPIIMNTAVNIKMEAEDEVENKEHRCINHSLRLVMLSGDWIPLNLPQRIKQLFCHAEVISLGGATEGSIWSIYYPVKDVNETWKSIPYGYPLANQSIYVLNYQMEACPVNTPGELYIGGVGVAEGYMGDEEKTRNSFIKHPVLGRIYKTGDYGVFRREGYIEFLGRIDQQVKIRGYRVELGEIETQLLTHPRMKDAVVVDKKDEKGGNYLCGYVVREGAGELLTAELRDYLSDKLPEYMIPLHFVQLEEIPLTSNGKIDRKALPKPELKAGEGYMAPQSGIEKKMVGLWSEILGRDALHVSQLQTSIGINDNFFELGGDSLKVITVTFRIHKELNIKIPLSDFFINPTIEGLAGYIKANEKKNIYHAIKPVEKKEYYPLSSTQKRMYVVQQMNTELISYNILEVLILEGEVIMEKVEEIVKKIVKSHESLRTSFEVIKGEPKQRIHDEIVFEMEYHETSEEKIPELVENFISPFNLAEAPLMRAGLIKTGKERQLLMTDMHHIISDGVSINILSKNFLTFYRGEELPALNLQYKDYSEWQNNLVVSVEIERQMNYWLNTFAGEIPILNLPTDFPRPTVQDFEGDYLYFHIDEELFKKLDHLTKETGTTFYMFLLAVLNLLLSKYTGQEDIVIGSPISGRTHADLENIIGMFVGQLALRNRPSRNKTFREFLAEVKENALRAFENQDCQFDVLVNRLGLMGNYSRHPLFDVVFAFQDWKIPDPEIPGLKLKQYEYEEKTSKTDLRFGAEMVNAVINIRLTYATSLFKRTTIEKMAKRYMKILRQVLEMPDIELAEITIEHGLVLANPTLLDEKNSNFEF